MPHADCARVMPAVSQSAGGTSGSYSFPKPIRVAAGEACEGWARGETG